jgi:hypothetical protein
MNDYHSNDEFLSALRALIEQWCDERQFAALSQILPAYLAFNGLSDGWHLLCSSLKATRGLGREAFSDADWSVLSDLIRAADRVVYPPSNSN